MIYKTADALVKRVNRYNLEHFDRLKLVPMDELNVIRSVTDTFQASVRQAKTAYRKMAESAYRAALLELGWSEFPARQQAARRMTDEWLDLLLAGYDPVTLYRFDTEVERRRQRLTEAMVAAPGRGAEIDRALRSWSRQIGQYSITVTDAARLQAYQDEGVEQVMWHTEEDGRVCEVCAGLDGQVFPADAAPAKQHYNCRCWLTAVGGSERRQPNPYIPDQDGTD